MRVVKCARAWRPAALGLLVFALLTGGAPCAAAAAGVRYEPAGGGFSITFPATPEKRTSKRDMGSVALTVSACGLDYEGMSYFVSWVGDLPPEAASDPLMEELLYTRMEQNFSLLGKATGNDSLSVASRSELSLGGHGGRQYVFNLPKAVGVMRGFLVGRRFYTVGVFGEKAAFSAQRAVDFLESFQFTAKKQKR